MPSDAQVISHALMLRAGYVRQISAGVYSYLPLANRVIEKAKKSCGKNLRKLVQSKCWLQHLLSADLWRESGRYETYGEDLYKLKIVKVQTLSWGQLTKKHSPQLYGFCQVFKQLPLNLYQIQAKYRDEKRPRNGLFRGHVNLS